MPIKKQIEYETFNEQGKRFIKMWNGKYKKEEIAQHFNMSIPTVKRLARKLKVIPKNDYKNHPYQKKLKKKIRVLYYKGYSTISIARIKNVSDETVRRRLQRMNITLRERHEKNVLYNSYTANAKHNYSPTFLRTKIKELYEKGLPSKYIAKQLRIDEDVVMGRIKAMNLEVRLGGQSHLKYNGLAGENTPPSAVTKSNR